MAYALFSGFSQKPLVNLVNLRIDIPIVRFCRSAKLLKCDRDRACRNNSLPSAHANSGTPTNRAKPKFKIQTGPLPAFVLLIIQYDNAFAFQRAARSGAAADLPRAYSRHGHL